MKADAIEFEFNTDGDDLGYYYDYYMDWGGKPGDLRMGIPFSAADGFDHYKVTGYRYTGFADDEE